MSFSHHKVGQVYRFKGGLVEIVRIEGAKLYYRYLEGIHATAKEPFTIYYPQFDKRATLINSEVPKDGNIKAS